MKRWIVKICGNPVRFVRSMQAKKVFELVSLEEASVFLSADDAAFIAGSFGLIPGKFTIESI